MPGGCKRYQMALFVHLGLLSAFWLSCTTVEKATCQVVACTASLRPILKLQKRTWSCLISSFPLLNLAPFYKIISSWPNKTYTMYSTSQSFQHAAQNVCIAIVKSVSCNYEVYWSVVCLWCGNSKHADLWQPFIDNRLTFLPFSHIFSTANQDLLQENSHHTKPRKKSVDIELALMIKGIIILDNVW